jgi:hypothetical protein
MLHFRVYSGVTFEGLGVRALAKAFPCFLLSRYGGPELVCFSHHLQPLVDQKEGVGFGGLAHVGHLLVRMHTNWRLTVPPLPIVTAGPRERGNSV